MAADPTNRRIVIVGAGGFGREVRDLVGQLSDGSVLAGFIDDADTFPVPLGAAHLGGIETDAVRDAGFVIAVGATKPKRAIAARLGRAGRVPASPIVHPMAVIGTGNDIGRGSVITAGCVLTTNIRVGEHVILNLGTTVGHDAVIGDFVSAMPGVHISGNVTLGAGVFIGTNAAVLEGVVVGEDATIGAGSLVNKDVAPGTTVVGVPARPLGG